MTKSNEKSEAYEKWKSTAALMFEGKTKKERLLSAFVALFFVCLGFILCAKELPIMHRSLGLPQADALLCASSIYTPFAYAGIVIGSVYFGHGSIERFLVLTFIFVLRIVSSAKTMSAGNGTVFSESVLTKTAIASVMSFIETGTYLAKHGINGESALTAAATLSALPALTLLFSAYYAKPDKGRFQRGVYELALTALFSIAVYCAGAASLTFVSADTLLAVFFILSIAKYGGAVRATITGFILGYIVSPAYFLSFLLFGLTSALTLSFGVFSAIGIATAVACVSSVLIGGHVALYYFIPDTVISCAIASPIIRYSFLPKSFPYPFCDPNERISLSDAERVAYAGINACGALRKTSDGLRALSSEIGEITASPPETSHPQSEILEKVCEGFCEKCTMSPICLESEVGRTRLAINDLISYSFEENGELTDNIPPYLSGHCIKLRELSEYIISLCSSYKKNKYRSIAPVIGNSPNTALLSYASCADILSALAESSEKELVFDKEAEVASADVFHKAGISFSSLSVIGASRKKLYLYGAKTEKVKGSLSDLLASLSKLFSCRYDCASLPQNDGTPIIFTPAERLEAEASVAFSAKHGETVNGDTATTFSDGDGNFYALLADGMGSGEAALRSSSMTASLIKNLLIGRLEQKLAVRLTDEVLSRTCDECFSTVDLMKLDLINGKTTVTKSYACASYVLRGGSVYRCDASSMPIGISSDSTPFETEFILNDGDTVIMISDGIADCPENDLRIPDIVGLSSHLTPKELADRILTRAIEVNGKKDDMSALVIKIKKAS